MGLKIVWECDSCGNQKEGQSADGMPRDWFVVQSKENFKAGYICKACCDTLLHKTRAKDE